MVSRIDAVIIKVLTKNGYDKETMNRGDFYTFKSQTKEKLQELNGFIGYDKAICLWNFIKHNSLRSYMSLKENYPDTLIGEEYKQGDLAIYYINLDENLMNSLLDDMLLFFQNYCERVFHEDPEETEWNYDKYFLSQVRGEIESWTNSLGLDMFDDID